MRLLFVHDNPFSRHGGRVYSQGSISSATWRRFLPHVDEVVVAARHREATEAQVLKLNAADADGVCFALVERLPYSRLLPGWHEAHQTLRREVDRADAVVVRLPSILGRLAGSIALGKGKRVAAEVVGCPFDAYWNYGSLAGKALALSEPIRMRRLLRKIPFAVYVTREFLQRRYPCPGQTESASNVELATPDRSLLDHRLEHFSVREPRVFNIGLIGSYVHKYKGWDTAIRAVHRLSADHQVRLHLLGQGDPQTIEVFAAPLGVADRVVCDGVLPMGGPVMQWLDQLDCYIQPSLQEGLPRSVIEAMSRGLPCIGTRVGGMAELLDASCIIEKHDDQALAAGIARLITDPAFARAQAQRNFEAVTPYYADRLEAHREAIWGGFIRPLASRGVGTMPPR